MKSFRAVLEQSGKTATGITVPESVVASFNAGKRIAVTTTINGYSYRSSVAPYGGDYMLPVSAEHRAGAGISAGDVVEVVLELDTVPREVVIPADFAAAMAREPEARQFFDGLSYSNRSRFVLSIEAAKTPETRQRRIEKSVSDLREGHIG